MQTTRGVSEPPGPAAVTCAWPFTPEELAGPGSVAHAPSAGQPHTLHILHCAAAHAVQRESGAVGSEKDESMASPKRKASAVTNLSPSHLEMLRSQELGTDARCSQVRAAAAVTDTPGHPTCAPATQASPLTGPGHTHTVTKDRSRLTAAQPPCSGTPLQCVSTRGTRWAHVRPLPQVHLPPQTSLSPVFPLALSGSLTDQP